MTPSQSLPGKPCVLQVLVSRAPDVPGEWVAHCLNLDVISQGRSVREAIDAVCEAVTMVVEADLARGVDPLKRESAPEEFWESFSSILRRGQPVGKLDEEQVVAVATAIQVVRGLHPALDPEYETLRLPEAWQIAALQSSPPSHSRPC